MAPWTNCTTGAGYHPAVTSPARRNRPFYLLLAGALVFLTIPRMAQPGMFLDGAIYASIARNHASGLGSFWFPYYVEIDSPFHEHPPLAFALQAVPFALFGDHLAVERGYSFLAAALTLLLIVATWRRTVGRREYDWLPGVFWLLPSTVTWSIVNNLLETTQALFTTAAVLAIAWAVERPARAVTGAVAASVCVVAAVLTKGPTGLFPLAAPAIAFLLFHERRAIVVKTAAVMIGTGAAAAAALAAWTPARQAMTTYWNVQVMQSIQGSRGGGRWHSLARHLGGGIFLRMGVLLGGAALLGSDRCQTGVRPPVAHDTSAGPTRQHPWDRRWIWFFALLALCASVPVAFSARVSGHYLVPAVPMFALAFASGTLALVERRFDAWRDRRAFPAAVGALGSALLIVGVGMPLSGRVMEPRDASWIAEYRALAPSLPRGATLGTCEALRHEWGVHAYLQRFFRISLDPSPARPRGYYLQITDRPCDAPASCRQVAATARFALFTCGV